MVEETGAALFSAVAVSVGGGIMRGYAGFGSGMLMAPVFAVLFGPVQAVAIVIILEIVATLQLMSGTLGHVNWRLVGGMGAAATAFMPLGSWLLVSLDPHLLTRMIAFIVLLFVIVLMGGWRYTGTRRNWLTAGVGAVSGTMMAATGLGNPPVMLYLMSGNDSAVTNRSNITAYFAVTLTTLLIVMLMSGLVSTAAGWRAALLLPFFSLGTWLGSRLFRKSSETAYRRLALAILFCAGVFGLLY